MWPQANRFLLRALLTEKQRASASETSQEFLVVLFLSFDLCRLPPSPSVVVLFYLSDVNFLPLLLSRTNQHCFLFISLCTSTTGNTISRRIYNPAQNTSYSLLAAGESVGEKWYKIFFCLQFFFFYYCI